MTAAPFGVEPFLFGRVLAGQCLDLDQRGNSGDAHNQIRKPIPNVCRIGDRTTERGKRVLDLLVICVAATVFHSLSSGNPANIRCASVKINSSSSGSTLIF